MIVTVAGLKGGISKTTTAAYLAHALAEGDRAVVALDADPQGSLLTWADWADWPITVEKFDPARVEQLHPLGWDVVIDTPPFDEGATAAAVKLATVVVYPVGPSPIEYERTDAMRALLARYAPQAWPVVLLTRCVTGATSTEDYRRRLVADGWHVLRVPVARRERFALSFGQPVTRAYATAYGDALAELHTLEVSR